MKNLKLLSLLLIGIFWMGSCAKKDLKQFDFAFDEAFEIQIGDFYTSKNEVVNFKIHSILYDNRCPIDAMCIIAGEIKFEVEIVIGDQVFVKELIYQDNQELTLEIGEFIFQIIEVLPGNQIDETIELEDYIFTLIIKEN